MGVEIAINGNGVPITHVGTVALTEQELAVVRMVARDIVDARMRWRTGKISFDIEINNGCVTHKWTNHRYKEK
jgi:hypothetical protein